MLHLVCIISKVSPTGINFLALCSTIRLDVVYSALKTLITAVSPCILWALVEFLFHLIHLLSPKSKNLALNLFCVFLWQWTGQADRQAGREASTQTGLKKLQLSGDRWASLSSADSSSVSDVLSSSSATIPAPSGLHFGQSGFWLAVSCSLCCRGFAVTLLLGPGSSLCS